MISKIFFWNLFTCKGTYMIDWVGRGTKFYWYSQPPYPRFPILFFPFPQPFPTFFWDLTSPHSEMDFFKSNLKMRRCPISGKSGNLEVWSQNEMMSNLSKKWEKSGRKGKRGWKKGGKEAVYNLWKLWFDSYKCRECHDDRPVRGLWSAISPFFDSTLWNSLRLVHLPNPDKPSIPTTTDQVKLSQK